MNVSSGSVQSSLRFVFTTSWPVRVVIIIVGVVSPLEHSDTVVVVVVVVVALAGVVTRGTVASHYNCPIEITREQTRALLRR